MKKLFIFTVLTILSTVTPAQIFTPTPNEELNQARKPYELLFNYTIPTGVLADINIGSSIFKNHKGLETDSSNTPFEMFDIVQNLKNASGNYDVLPSIESMQERIGAFRNTGFIPISLIHYSYAKFTDSLFDSDLLEYDTIEEYFWFTADPGVYIETDTVFAFAVHGILHNTNNPRFVFPSDLYFNNLNSQEPYEVDFGDGSGWRPLAFDQPYVINLNDMETEVEDFVIKLKKTNSIHSILKTVTKRIKILTPDETHFVSQLSIDNPCVIPSNSEVDEARFYLRYGNAQSVSKQLKKPFILVEGFDIDVNPHDNKFGVIDWVTFIAGLSFDENNNPTRQNLADLRVLAQRLYDEDYDCILVDFKDGAGDLFKNGNALIKIIQWVNQTKTSDEELVIMGASMGGLIARYALRTMELEGCHHCTKLYGTFDSPHQGANVPVALQAIIKNLANLSMEAKAGLMFLQKPAAQQMLIFNLTDKEQVVRNKWQNHLNQIGHPQIPKRIAITNGSPNGSPNAIQHAGDKMYDFRFDLKIDAYLTGIGGGFIKAKKWYFEPLVGGVLNSQQKSGNQIISEYIGISEEELRNLRGDKELTKQTLNSILWQRQKHSNFRILYEVINASPLDNASGGQSGWVEMLDNVINKIDMNVPQSKQVKTSLKRHIVNNLGINFFTTFVPAYSGLDLSSNLYNPDLLELFPNSTAREVPNVNEHHPFHAIFFHKDPDNPFVNQAHVFVDGRQGQNIDFIMNQLKTVNRKLPRQLPTGKVGETTFNFNHPDYSNRIPSMNISTNGVLYLNKEGFGDFGKGEKPTTTNYHFEYHTNGCGAHIVLEDGGQLVVGDDNNVLGANNRANLYIMPGSILEVKNEGVLRVQKGSKVVVEEGAVIVVHEGAKIQLFGTQADLEIKGHILVKDQATFKLENTHAPERGKLLLYHTQKNKGRAILPEGNGSKIEITGNKVWETSLVGAKMGPIVLKGFDEVNFSKTRIEIEPNAHLAIHDKCRIEYVRFIPARNKAGTLALETFGQSGQAIQLNQFDGLQTGVKLSGVQLQMEITIAHNTFVNCDEGVLAGNCKPKLQWNTFQNCLTGIGLSQLEEALVENNKFFANNSAVYIHSCPTNAHLIAASNLFKNNQTGIENNSNASLSVSCNRFIKNTTALNSAGQLNISTHQNINGKTAGFNTFYHNQKAIYLSNAALWLEQGKNNFIADPYANTYDFITGSIENNCNCLDANGKLKADQNYWFPQPSSGHISNAGSKYYHLVQNTFPHANPVYLSGNVLSQAEQTCYHPSDEEFTDDNTNTQNKQGDANAWRFHVKIFPNPFSSDLTLFYNLTEIGDVFVRLYNTMGQEVWSSSALSGQKGNNIAYILLPPYIASGVYQIKVVSQDGEMKQTIIKQ